MGLSSDRPNFPDSGNQTERNKNARTWSFHERYAGDPEFKRQIDEGRQRSKERREQDALKSALSMTREHRRIY